jgi:hypothetical protein
MGFFEDEKKRVSKLMETFKHTATTEVLGLVAATGAGGSKLKGEEQWTVRFKLENWKYLEEGLLKNKNLTVQRTVTEEQLSEFRDVIDPYTPYHLKVKIVENSELSGAQAYLEDLISKSDDEELLALATELQKPVTFNDELLGKFTLDRTVDWFESETIWDKETIHLNLTVDERGNESASLKIAKKLWEDQEVWSEKIIDFAVKKLLDLKNDTWLDEDESELTAVQFIERMTLEAIAVYPDGKFEFWHNDGDLFWGHSIQISGNINDGPTDADIPG